MRVLSLEEQRSLLNFLVDRIERGEGIPREFIFVLENGHRVRVLVFNDEIEEVRSVNTQLHCLHFIITNTNPSPPVWFRQIDDKCYWAKSGYSKVLDLRISSPYRYVTHSYIVEKRNNNLEISDSLYKNFMREIGYPELASDNKTNSDPEFQKRLINPELGQLPPDGSPPLSVIIDPNIELVPIPDGPKKFALRNYFQKKIVPKVDRKKKELKIHNVEPGKLIRKPRPSRKKSVSTPTSPSTNVLSSPPQTQHTFSTTTTTIQSPPDPQQQSLTFHLQHSSPISSPSPPGPDYQQSSPTLYFPTSPTYYQDNPYAPPNPFQQRNILPLNYQNHPNMSGYSNHNIQNPPYGYFYPILPSPPVPQYPTTTTTSTTSSPQPKKKEKSSNNEHLYKMENDPRFDPNNNNNIVQYPFYYFNQLIQQQEPEDEEEGNPEYFIEEDDDE